MRIPPFKYAFSTADADSIAAQTKSLLLSGEHLTMGRHGEELEARFAEYAGVEDVVAVSSGTAALEIILRSLKITDGEVIVPTNTFGATVVPVLRVGATPVFVDAADDLSASAADVERHLSAATRAVIAVHIGGLVSPHLKEIARLCRQAGVPLIEDAAHAIGARLDGRHAPSYGVAAAFSLFSTKVITSGEGGLLATTDHKIASHARHLRDHAKEPDGTMRGAGYSWRLTEFQAIVACRQLARLDEIVAGRSMVARWYDHRIDSVEGVRRLPVPVSVQHNWYKYVVFVDSRDPADLMTLLREGYDVSLGGWVYRTPCHQQQAFEQYVHDRYPRANELCRSHICLPIYPGMSEAEVDYVVESLRSVMARPPLEVTT